MPRSRRHPACRRSGGEGRRPGAAQDANVAHVAVAYRRRRPAVMDHRRLLPLHGDPLPILDVRRPRRGRRAGARTGDQRPALDRGALPYWLQAVPGVGRQDLRVRRTHDPRQDRGRGRLVVEGRLNEPERRQSRRQLGDRPGGGRSWLRRRDGEIVRRRPFQRPRGATRRNGRTPAGASATILRVGSTALQKSGYPLATHEKALAAAASGALLGVSLLSLRFPRFLAWPLAATGAIYGGLGVLRAARSALSDRKP